MADLSAYSARDVLANRRVVDTVVPPILFVSVYGLAGLVPAAALAVAASAALGVVRAVRREDPSGALGGVFATALAAGIAMASGRAEDYFLPRVVSNTAIALVLAGSIVVRRPVAGVVAQALYRFPPAWVAHPPVRRVFAELTWPWVALCLLRATLYAVLIDAGEVGWLAVASFLLGWPSFAAIMVGSYAFFRWRVAQRDIPGPDAFAEPGGPATPGRPAPG